jgi:HAD superfamily hydrolase (TIGR01509 family)
MSTELNDAADPRVLPAAVLWDMDGTLIDSECYWIAACRELIEQHGGELEVRDEAAFVGASMTQTAALVVARGVDLPITEVIDIISATVRESMASLGAPLLPGVESLLRALADADVPTAMVTMSYAENAAVLLEVMRKSGLPPFDVLVAGDHVSKGKPDPECYLLAARKLNVDPGQCLAFEDSVTGGSAAVAAGVPTLLVSDQVTVAGSLSRSGLAGVDLPLLAQLWQSSRAEINR